LLSPIASYGGAAGIGPSDPFDRDIQDLNAGSAEVRRNAASGLANAGIKASRAVPALIAMLPAESDPEARREIVRAIGSAGSRTPDAVPALVEVMEHDPSDELRAGAARSLGRIETTAEIAVPALLRALESSAPAVRAAAAQALGAKSYAGFAAQSVPPLAAALTDADSTVRISAVEALREIGPSAVAAVPALRKLLADRSNSERFFAARTVGAIGHGAAAAAPECFAALRDENPQLRVEAAAALLAFGEHVDAAMAALVDAMAFVSGGYYGSLSLQNAVHMRAAAVMGKYNQYATGPAALNLARAMEEVDPDVRRQASNAFDKVLASLVTRHRIDAIPRLKQARAILDAGKAGSLKAKTVAVDAAIAALERRRSAALALGVGALACVLGAAVVRKRGLEGLGLRRTRRVFLCYRRQDSASICGRVYDRLVAHFGAKNVFRDIDSLAPGERFADKIRECIGRCDAVVVLIGRQWIAPADDPGRRRLDDAADFVRREVGEAAAQERYIVPVLHDDARMPDAKDLPADIAFLAQRHAIRLTDEHFGADVKQIVDAISNAPAERPAATDAEPEGAKSAPRARWLENAAAQLPLALVALGLLLAAAGAWVGYGFLLANP